MDALLEFIKNLQLRYQELTPGKKSAAMVLGAVVVASLVVMSFWLQAPDYQTLYGNLSEEDAANILEELKSKKTPYQLSNQGKTIRVPSAQVHEIRLELASKGLPKGSEVGLELFEDTPLGMTEFVQKLNFQRALQGELARTIKSLDAVDQARIHLVIPKDTLFLKEKPEGKASVMLKIHNGRTLSAEQVQGVIHLVSSSVEGVSPKNVVVVDIKGNILSGDMTGSSEAMVASSNFKHKLKVEKALQTKILKMLEEALGPGKVVARVSAELNMERAEQTEETFDPDSQVVRSEQRTEESTTGAVPPGGIAGVQSLLPEGRAQPGVPGSAAQRSKENQTLNYEINKVIKRTIKPMGEIKKLSVSVLIDGSLRGDPAVYTARTPEEMGQFLELVKTAVGYDEARGDQINVKNAQFDKTLIEEQQAQMERESKIDLGMQGAKYLLALVFLILLFSRVLRPIATWMTTSVEVIEHAALPTAEEEAIEDEKRRLAAMGSQSQEMRKAVTSFVSVDPKVTAGILRKWLKERGV